MSYVGGHLVPQASEVDAAQWFPVAEALTRLTYPNDRKLVHRGVALWNQQFPPSDADDPPDSVAT